MSKFLTSSVIIIFSLSMISCTSYMDKYNQESERAHYFRGLKLQDIFVSIIEASPDEIEFKIRRAPRLKYLYHVILDKEEFPVAEGWYSAYRIKSEHYKVKMKAKKGYRFEPGEKYRLCVLLQNPELLYFYSKNVRCIVDYAFVYPSK
ncbi:MAG: hypothetical protein ACETWK_05515 [Candidatus Aminicenantaceae bacterium]